MFSSLVLNRAYLGHTVFERRGGSLMHRVKIRSFNKIGGVAVATKQRFEFLVTYPRRDCRIINFIAVQMEYGQNGTVSSRIDEFVRVPGCRQRASLRLAVSDDPNGDQVRVV